ncbi:MAG: aminopeptidase C [Hyphomicrobiales bacterium]
MLNSYLKPAATLMLAGSLLFSGVAFGQDKKEEKEEKGYKFTEVKDIPVTSVKNQYRSGTCWSFSGLGLMEAEIIRKGGEPTDLSEMFVVRNCYSDKAEKYVRLHGSLNLAAGGGFSDILYVMKNYGMVPENAYEGLNYGEKKHTHGEMDVVLKDYADAVIKNKNRKLTPAWHKGFDGILDAYLGEYPSNFKVEGKEYTPESYLKSLGLNADDYIEISSFTHKPYYKPFIMELPDNWMWAETYNVPLDDMMEIIDNALENGYTVAWASDVSEKGFSWSNGVAVVPDAEREDLAGTEKEKWEKLTSKEKRSALYSFDKPVKEKKITPEMRQAAYDNWETTDDHGMLLTGISKDQEGNRFYKVKNSWGNENHKYDGYFYASKPFVAYKTTNIMIHKDAVPKSIRKKLGLK